KHPDRTPPLLHRSDALLENADQLRARLGDDAFFDAFDASGTASAGWGSFAAALTPAEYDAARHKAAGDPQRQRVVAELVKAHFPAFAQTGTWLDMTSGLQAMTAHAKELGY